MRRRRRLSTWGTALTFLALALGALILGTAGSTRELLTESEGDSITNVDESAIYAEETATFALGCFWGADALFGALPGVVRTTVGYAGGTHTNPTYYDIGDHAEAVQVVFYPLVLAYEDLLATFWFGHDACSRPLNPQYRSLLLVHSERQRQQAEASYEAQIEVSGSRPTTVILPLADFTRAEDYHQKFRVQSEPALTELLLARFDTFDAFVDSTLVARVNGVLGREAAIDQVEGELSALGLSDEGIRLLRKAVGATCEPPQAEAFDPTWRAEQDAGGPPASCPLPEA